MVMMKCSFSRVVVLVFSCLLGYYVYNMYTLFYPAQCSAKPRSQCLHPAYPSDTKLEVPK